MRFCVIVAAVFILSASMASASVVLNIDGKWSGGAALTLGAGDWLCEFVNPEVDSRASYWAWYMVYGNEPWHDPNTLSWATAYYIQVGSNGYSAGGFSQGLGYVAASRNTVSAGTGILEFTTTQQTTINARVADSVFWDNMGGVSLRFTQVVPEPSCLLALLTGIGGLGGMMWRRRK